MPPSIPPHPPMTGRRSFPHPTRADAESHGLAALALGSAPPPLSRDRKKERLAQLPLDQLTSEEDRGPLLVSFAASEAATFDASRQERTGTLALHQPTANGLVEYLELFSCTVVVGQDGSSASMWSDGRHSPLLSFTLPVLKGALYLFDLAVTQTNIDLHFGTEAKTPSPVSYGYRIDTGEHSDTLQGAYSMVSSDGHVLIAFRPQKEMPFTQFYFWSSGADPHFWYFHSCEIHRSA